MISRSPRPAWRAASASGLRSAAGSVSRARLAAQNRPALRLPSGWLATHRARSPRSRVPAWGWRGLEVRFGLQEPGDGGPVQAAAAAGCRMTS